ncbi:glycosyl hydrolase family 28 protein [Saccharibacillus sacchari]|uniref:Glycosyl hydrolase family 28 protein n=1 Tax=Saccharibacillus sacchari TaxID=456493 RepID=A0ACC6PBS6_9BACL
MHDVRFASMVSFDCEGAAELEIEHLSGIVNETIVRPLSAGIQCSVEHLTIKLRLDGPRLLSLETNGERFRNLHIFANSPEKNIPFNEAEEVLTLEPGIHRGADIRKALEQRSAIRTSDARCILAFEPGLHTLEDDRLSIPSHTTVYLAGGAVLRGGLVCDTVRDVEIRGRGVLDLSGFEKTTFYRGVDVRYSSDISIEGITMIDPPHYTVLLGQSKNIHISNLKTFSSRGWCDGIDMMACRDVKIEGGFLRTSDDCIAVYASRGEFRGDTVNVSVQGAILWADVAHPINIGTHGDYEGEGNLIEHLRFCDIDILEHHEPQPDYWGCIAINAGDNNTVRAAAFENIRVEPFELGEPFNIRVMKNEKYNPAPGYRIEQVSFRHINFEGCCPNPSHISGYDEERFVNEILFENVTLNGQPITLKDSDILVGDHVTGLTIK